ncbi:MAG: T9SS type A sorting domain-containing protein [Bacteroidetes bacterium]|nr:T9SS type A sorting domain-containing protein [Bacteroidota bacterium]MDA1121189.1 T9SS type A sorting domain-containing protein [Bacteroidota bacterium]
MAETASLNYDDLDGFNMPRFFDEYLELNYDRKEGNDFYSRDVVPTTPDYTWDFSIVSNSNEPILSLRWDNSYFGENDKELYLWDVNLLRPINMRQVDSYTFDKSRSQSFRVFFGSKEFLKEKIIVNELVLHTVWPNPSTGYFKVSFTLPEASQDQHVELILVDMLGRLTWSTSGDFTSGYHEITWNRTNEIAEGLYVIQLKLGATYKQERLVLKNE